VLKNLPFTATSLSSINIPFTLPLLVKTRVIEGLPKILKPSLRFLPYSIQSSVLIPALHSAFSEALVDGDFDFLVGKWLKISITDIDMHWWLSVEDNRLIMANP
jgi:O2-independent ubiquinone biosynthesis accessory factor UbiT